MRLREISQALGAVAEIARVGQRLIGSVDRSRNHAGSIALGIGLGVGLGALLFSESARQHVRTWLAPVDATTANEAAHADMPATH